MVLGGGIHWISSIILWRSTFLFGRPFQKFYLSCIPTRSTPGGQIRTVGGARANIRGNEPVTEEPAQHCHRIHRRVWPHTVFWNMQSLSSSSSKVINYMSMSAYTSLAIVVVKKIGPTIYHRLMAHHTPTLGDTTRPHGIHADFLWTTSCNFANLRTRPFAPTFHH